MSVTSSPTAASATRYTGTGESAAAIRKRVVAARKIQQKRFHGLANVACNARIGTCELKQVCAIDEAAKGLIQFAMADLHLSARAYDRILMLRAIQLHLREAQDQVETAFRRIDPHRNCWCLLLTHMVARTFNFLENELPDP